MAANPTHRTRLAKTFVKTTAYQHALTHVVDCAEAGMLSARLDDAGLAQALTVLQRSLENSSLAPCASRWSRPQSLRRPRGRFRCRRTRAGYG